MSSQTWTWYNAHKDEVNTSIQHPYKLVKHLETLKKGANEHSLDILPARQTHSSYSWLGAACPLPSKEISAWIKANIPRHIIEADSQDDYTEDTHWNDCLDFHAAVRPDGQSEQNGETPSPSTKKKKPLITYRARKSSTTSRNSASTSVAVGRKPLKLAPILQFREFLEVQATQASQRTYSPPPAAQPMQKEDVPNNPKKRPVRTKAALSEVARPNKRLVVASDKGEEKGKDAKLQPAELLQMHARTRLKGIVSGIIHDQAADATTSTNTRATRRMHAHPVPFPIQAQAVTRPVKRLTRAGRQSALDRGSEGDTQVIDPATFLVQEESTEIIEDFSSAAIVVQNDDSNNDETEMDISEARPAAGHGTADEDIHTSREITFQQNSFNDPPPLQNEPVASTSKLPSPPQAIPPAPPLSSSITSTSFTSASSSLNFQYVPLSRPPASRPLEVVLQSTGLAPPPDSVSHRTPKDDSNMDIDTSANSVNDKIPEPAQPRRSPRQKQEKSVKMTLFARKSTRPSEVVSAKSKGKQLEESAERGDIPLASFLRLVFDPPPEERPSKRLKEAEESPKFSRPCIPKHIPFRTLTSPIPLSPIAHTYVDSKDLYTGGIFGSGYLGPGRRGYWILPLTAFESPLQEEGEHRPSQGVVLGLSRKDTAPKSPDPDDQDGQIVWTYTRLRVFFPHLRKMAQSSRWGFMDVFPATLPFSTSPNDTSYCIKICIASSLALMLRSALSEFACRLHARTKEELEEFADDTDADAGIAGTKWLDSRNGMNLVWWDEIERREILLA